MRHYTRGFIKSAGIISDIIAQGKAEARINKINRIAQSYPTMQRWYRENPQPQYTPQSTDQAVHRQQFQQWQNNVYKPWQQRRADQQRRIHDQLVARQYRLVKAHNESPYTDSSVEQPYNMYTHLRKSLGGAPIKRVAPNTYQANHKDLYIGMYKDRQIGQRNWYRMLDNRAKQWAKRGGPGTYTTIPHVPPRPRNKQIGWLGQWSSAPSDYLRIYTNRYSDDNAQVYYSDMRGLALQTPSSLVTLPSQIVPQKQFALIKALPVSAAFSTDAQRYATPRHQVQGHGLAQTGQSQPVGNSMPSNRYTARGVYDFLADMPVSDRVDYIGYSVPQMAGAMIRFKPDATNAFKETPETFDQAATKFVTEGYAKYDPKAKMVRMTKKYVDSAKVPDPDMQALLTAWYRAKHPQAVPKQLPYKPFFTPWRTKVKQYKPPQGYDPEQWLQDAQFYYRMSNNAKRLRDKYVV